MKFIVNVFKSIGNRIDKAEKFLLGRGLPQFVTSILMLCFIVSCSEKMNNPYNSQEYSPAPYANDTSISAIGSSMVGNANALFDSANKQIVNIPPIEEMNSAQDSLKDYQEGLVTERATPKADSIIIAQKLLKTPNSIAVSEKLNKKKTNKAPIRGNRLKVIYECPCLRQESVTSSKQTVTYFVNKYRISKETFIQINKPQVWLNKDKLLLKKGINVCLKRKA